MGDPTNGEIGFDAEGSLPPPLGSWDYPVWLTLFAVAAVVVLGMALVPLPQDIRSARALHQAKEQASAGRYREAERLFVDVLREVPDSKAARLSLAQAMFDDGDPRNDTAALKALDGMTLSKSEWQKVSRNMPAQYRALFKKGE